MAGPGRARMLAAAAIIQKDAARRAAVWSRQIPGSLKITATDSTADITTGVGPAYPNEAPRVRHPVFGPTDKRLFPPWVTNKHRPFLAPAAVAKADAVAVEIAKSIDDIAHNAGFRGSG
jgi:hypothetical protein